MNTLPTIFRPEPRTRTSSMRGKLREGQVSRAKRANFVPKVSGQVSLFLLFLGLIFALRVFSAERIGEQKVFYEEVVFDNLILNPGSAPGTPTAGQIYYDSTENKTYFYNASAWTEMGGGAGLWTDQGTFVYPNNYTSFVITDAGSVGIGTTGPGDKLDVVGGNIATNNYLAIKSWAGTWGTGQGQIWFDGVGGSGNATGYLSIGANANNQLNIQVGGNVGIGTTGPQGILDIASAAPLVYFDETDQTDPAGDFRFGVSGNTFYIQTRNDADSLYLNLATMARKGSTYISAGGGEGTGDVILQTGGTDKFAVKSAGMLWQTGTGCGGIVPQGMIGMFDSACPSGWTEVTAFRNVFPRGHDADASYCESGGNICTQWFCYNTNVCYPLHYPGSQPCACTGYCGSSLFGPACTDTCISGFFYSAQEGSGPFCLTSFCSIGACTIGSYNRYAVCGPEIRRRYDPYPEWREVVFCKKD